MQKEAAALIDRRVSKVFFVEDVQENRVFMGEITQYNQ